MANANNQKNQEIELSNLKNIYDEILLIEDHFNSCNQVNISGDKEKRVNLVKTNKLKKLTIKINDYIELEFQLQYDYPKIPPNTMRLIFNKKNNLNYDKDELVTNFFKNFNLILNEVIDNNQGKCCVYKVFQKLLILISENSLFNEIFQYLNELTSLNNINDDFQKNSKLVNDDNLSQSKPKSKSYSKHHQSTVKASENDDEEEEKAKFKGSDTIFQRFKWDPSVNQNDVIIGYLDRFKGVLEIKFSEFKGVHEDREGIPLHRIRYYKIKNKIVWDREKKIDLLTGHDISEYFNSNKKTETIEVDPVDEVVTFSQELEAPLQQPKPSKSVESKISSNEAAVFNKNLKINQLTVTNVLKYDAYSSEWIEDKGNTNVKFSLSNAYINNLKINTYNILATQNFKASIQYAYKQGAKGCDKLLQFNRMDAIINELKANDADIIALQECDIDAENYFKKSPFIQKSYYICSSNHLNNISNCLILSKIRPVWFQLLNLNNPVKYALIMKLSVRIHSTQKNEDLIFVNLHLTSDSAANSSDKRRQQLELIINYLLNGNIESPTSNIKDLINKPNYYFICGDFNFGDDSANDRETVNSCLLSNGFVDLMPNKYTFDPKTNFTAAITSQSQKSRRFDRIYLKAFKNSSYSIDKRRLFNLTPLEFDKINGFNYEPYSLIKRYTSDNSVTLTDSDPKADINFNLNYNDLDSSKFYLHPSDHYGLEINLTFSNSLNGSDANYQAALAIIAPKDRSRVVQEIRSMHDRTYNRWPPHINLLYPFYENIDIDYVNKEMIQRVLSQFEPTRIKMAKLNYFARNCVVYIEPEKESEKFLIELQNKIKSLFLDLTYKGKAKADFTPHMTVAQPDDRRNCEKNWAEKLYLQLLKQYQGQIQFDFDVDAVYWITRKDGNEPFKVKYAFPLGKYYPSIDRGLLLSNAANNGVIGYLSDKNLMPKNECSQKELLTSSFNLITNIHTVLNDLKKGPGDYKFSNSSNSNETSFETLEPFYHKIIPIGSFVFGLQCHDIDLLILKQKMDDKKVVYNASAFEKPLQDFVNEFVHKLAQYSDDYYLVRSVSDAIVPIIEITLNKKTINYKSLIDNNITMIDLQIFEVPIDYVNKNEALSEIHNTYDDNKSENLLSSLNAVTYISYMKYISTRLFNNNYMQLFPYCAIFENDSLKNFIRNYKDFQVLISFVKHWASINHIYGKAYGFMGGISYAIMIVYYLETFFQKFQHTLELDNSNKRFISLITNFFEFYSTFKWHENIVSLVDLDFIHNETSVLFSEQRKRTPISILSTIYPYHNTTRNISENGKRIIISEFKRAVNSINKFKVKYSVKDETIFESKEAVYELCDTICEKPDISIYKHKITFKVYYSDTNALDYIKSKIKSKLQGLITSLERQFIKNEQIRLISTLNPIDETSKKSELITEFYIYIDCDFISDKIKQEINYACNYFCNAVCETNYLTQLALNFQLNF